MLFPVCILQTPCGSDWWQLHTMQPVVHCPPGGIRGRKRNKIEFTGWGTSYVLSEKKGKMETKLWSMAWNNPVPTSDWLSWLCPGPCPIPTWQRPFLWRGTKLSPMAAALPSPCHNKNISASAETTTHLFPSTFFFVFEFTQYNLPLHTLILFCLPFPLLDL